jgi:hypothetical protein
MPPQTGDQCCQATDGTKTLRHAVATCNVGEVGLPLTECGSTVADAGPADSGSSGGCAGAQCRTNGDCSQSPPQVCRMCSCALASVPADFKNPSHDVSAAVMQAYPNTPLDQFNITEALMVVPGPPAQYTVKFKGAPMAFPAPTQYCVVWVQGASSTEVGRFCISFGANAATTDVTYTKPGMSPTSVGTQPMNAGGGLSFNVPASVGFSYDPGLSFYWVSLVDTTQADRFPPTGALPITDIIGSP